MTRLPAALCCLLLLVACGDGAEEAVPAERANEAAPAAESSADAGAATPLPDDAPTVAVADVLGTFESTVHGLAVWEHPTTPYLGSVVAANGEAGLVLIPLDPETAPRTLAGTFDGGVSVEYLDDGRSLITAASGGEAVVFEVGDDRTLTEVDRSPFAEPRETNGLPDRVTPSPVSVNGSQASTVLTIVDGRLFAPGPDLALGLARGGEADDAPLTRLAAGSGNFGGVYRDGVVAVLDDQNRLKLLPWSAVARAIGAPIETVSLRPAIVPDDPFAVTPRLPELSLPETASGQD